MHGGSLRRGVAGVVDLVAADSASHPVLELALLDFCAHLGVVVRWGLAVRELFSPDETDGVGGEQTVNLLIVLSKPDSSVLTGQRGAKSEKVAITVQVGGRVGEVCRRDPEEVGVHGLCVDEFDLPLGVELHTGGRKAVLFN